MIAITSSTFKEPSLFMSATSRLGSAISRIIFTSKTTSKISTVESELISPGIPGLPSVVIHSLSV